MVSSGGGGTPKQPANPVPNGPTTSFGQSTPFDPSAGFDSVLPGGGWVTPEMMSNSWSSNAQARAAAPPPPAPAAAAGPPQQSPMAMFTQMLKGAYGPNGTIAGSPGMPRSIAATMPQDADSKALRNQLAMLAMPQPSNVGYGGGGGGGRGGNYGSSGGFGGRR